MEADMVKWGIIGTNFITDRFLAEALNNVDFQLTAVYSRSQERAEEYGKKYGAKLFFDDLDQFAKCKDIDAVYVASPNSLHKSHSLKLLDEGKHVLCEKTIASNSAELRQMMIMAESRQAILLEAMRSIHTPGFLAVKKNLNKLGTIRQVSFRFCQYSSRYDKFKQGQIENAFNPSFSNGALMDLGVYCVHPLVALFGMPENISAHCVKLENGIDGAGIIVAAYSGMQAELAYSKITDSAEESTIQGENGTLYIPRIAEFEKPRIQYRDGTMELLDETTWTGSNMGFELADFHHLIGNHQKWLEYLEYSGMELRLMDQARKQMNLNFPADNLPEF